MIRLVSQFDSERMRASVATPTCGPCCSCCCCCIVTTLTSSIVTARNLGKLVDIQTSNQTSLPVKPPKPQGRLFGFFLLPIALGVGFVSLINPIGNDESFIVTLSLTAIIFGGGLYVFHRKYGLPRKTALLIFLITIAALVGEFFAWVFLLGAS